ncbi:MAG: hypothetical protein KJP21_07825 [Bacteroidia bacterium]|nr:hypothetical protein [Bacteroidia bacterium]
MFYAIVYTLFHILLVLNSNLGITPDGISYLRIAESIVSAEPFYVDGSFISHWPPLYPLSIAFVISSLNVSALTAATIISSVTSFSFILFTNLIITRFLKSWVTILMFNIILFGGASMGVMQMGLSEPLFMCFLMITVLALINLDKISIWNAIVLGVLCGLMVMTRFAAIGLVLGIGIYMLIQSSSIIKTVAMSVVFVLSLLPWYLFTQAQNQAPMDRETVFHLITLKHLKGLAGSFYRFINPTEIVVLGILTLIALGILIWNKRAQLMGSLKKLFSESYSQLFILLMCSYLLFLFVSISFFDYKTPLNVRMLFPIYVLLLLTLFYIIRNIKALKVNWSMQLSLGIVVLVHLVSTTTYASDYINNGVGFTSEKWTNSETLLACKDFDQRTIYSNASNVLAFNNFKGVRFLPVKEDGGSTLVRKDYNENYERMIHEVIKGDGAIVIFDNKKWWPYLPSKEEISKSLENSSEVLILNDGKIYY